MSRSIQQTSAVNTQVIPTGPDIMGGGGPSYRHFHRQHLQYTGQEDRKTGKERLVVDGEGEKVRDVNIKRRKDSKEV